jgi:hypothetical protein
VASPPGPDGKVAVVPENPDPPGEDEAAPDPDDALIDEIGVESFPASDSPSSWSGPPTESR